MRPDLTPDMLARLHLCLDVTVEIHQRVLREFDKITPVETPAGLLSTGNCLPIETAVSSQFSLPPLTRKRWDLFWHNYIIDLARLEDPTCIIQNAAHDLYHVLYDPDLLHALRGFKG